MNELISVIIPVYNVENYLEKCIKSVIIQEYKNIEIIIINDGSTDNSKKICSNYEEKDKRIKLINIKNCGVSNARNIGIENANGKYITFIDADDCVEKDYVEKLYKICIDNNVDISICGIKNYNEKYEKTYSNKNTANKLLTNEEAIAEMLDERLYYANVWAKMYKASILKDIRFDVNLKIGEDLKFNIQAMEKANAVFINTELLLYNYLIRDNSVTRDKFNEKWQGEINLCEQIIEYEKKRHPNIYLLAVKRYIRINYSCIMKVIMSKDNATYLKLKRNILKYKNQGIYKNFKTKEKLKLFLVLYCRNLVVLIMKRRTFNE